jgi:hypothetical protein
LAVALNAPTCLSKVNYFQSKNRPNDETVSIIFLTKTVNSKLPIPYSQFSVAVGSSVKRINLSVEGKQLPTKKPPQ